MATITTHYTRKLDHLTASTRLTFSTLSTPCSDKDTGLPDALRGMEREYGWMKV
jgi:hypothetical protein